MVKLDEKSIKATIKEMARKTDVLKEALRIVKESGVKVKHRRRKPKPKSEKKADKAE